MKAKHKKFLKFYENNSEFIGALTMGFFFHKKSVPIIESRFDILVSNLHKKLQMLKKLLKKCSAPFKSKNFLTVWIYAEIKINCDIAARLKYTHSFNWLQNRLIFKQNFSVNQKKNHDFCIFIEFKIAKNTHYFNSRSLLRLTGVHYFFMGLQRK